MMLGDDPLMANVRAEATWLLEIILAVRPHPFDQEGFMRITERVWVEQFDDGDVGRPIYFQFMFDPFDGAEKGTLKTLTLRMPVKAAVAENCELLTTDQDELFWWAMWFADFRSTMMLNNNDIA